MRIQPRHRGVINPKQTICKELNFSGTKEAPRHSLASNFYPFSARCGTADDITCAHGELTKNGRTLTGDVRCGAF
jgi:hypothetical protein